ncbi:lipid A export permease/ATP-binding protein MsbA [Colwellia psychrerythraea]|uniref:Lipid A ABC exporter, fused ATPase and inner membrane subunits MsbA n=1 Tax=Colwellia psychrerythraea TaxID=28229 RepID=A0A099KRF3_COLPS|nr:lipid A export permease/ATP-binding protein MsbA [Colwellia psychrerythraea]KGJ92800.1 lipid A ABC exporter, fused ATPase and inner membrane subunits MsbA [Colwellia psychrerythraea]
MINNKNSLEKLPSDSLNNSSNITTISYRRLITYYLLHKKLICIALLALSSFSLVDAGMIYFVKPLIDQGLGKADSSTLQLGALLIIGIFLLRGLTSFTSNYAIAYVSSKVTYQIRQQAFNKLLYLPRAFFDNNSRGSLIAKLIYDSEQLSQSFASAVVVVIRESVIILVLLTMMFYNSWQLTLIFLVIAPIIALIINKVSKRFKIISRKLQTSMADVSQATEQAILNQQEIILLNTSGEISNKFEDINNHNRQQNMKLQATSAISNPVIQLIASFAIAAVLLLASNEQVLQQLSPGTFTLVLIAMGSLLKPLKQLSNINQYLQKGLTAADSMFSFLDEKEEHDSGTKQLLSQCSTITFKNLSFTYTGKSQPALKQFSLQVKGGTSVAFVGESGSGKSTLARLLLRLYQSPAQSIFINDIAIEKYNLASLRAQFAYVSQDIVLIDDTLANNIRFGCNRQVSNEEVEQAAFDANVTVFANELALGLNTQVGENGRSLSGGQRQRIAIARAILRDASIIILDEATSALDNHSEQHIQEAFTRLCKNKTLLVIAHKLSSIKNVDKIVVINQGELVEQGTHTELLAKAGYYRTMHTRDLS